MFRSHFSWAVGQMLRFPVPKQITSQLHNSGLFEKVNDFRTHYLRVGRGAHNLLLIPGPLGSAITDYTPFLENLNQLRFTAVAWDPPGQGSSAIPEERSWRTPGHLEQDATIGLQLMRQLNLIPFSILSWAEGVVTALLMFSSCSPDEIRKLVMWANEGAVPCPVPLSIRVTGSDALEPYRKLSKWPIAARAPLEAIYGPNQLKSRWFDYLEAKRRGIIYKNISAADLESKLRIQLDNQPEQTRLLLMRAPGMENTEDWLTYALSRLEQTRILNWMDQKNIQLEEYDYCWGPHRSNPQEFQTFVEAFLCFDDEHAHHIQWYA
ncbi:Valacyclovir hydrolase [Fasciola hepatica]|uniref:Valacyclovir hydrolase n=1 Tax=Fasciola hepatica TaxID=6192 RepID=A0A4E0RGP0_FASHE|nr:Valacyclovir hydrolase [Fasciola hepatica]